MEEIIDNTANTAIRLVRPRYGTARIKYLVQNGPNNPAITVALMVRFNIQCMMYGMLEKKQKGQYVAEIKGGADRDIM